MCVLATTRKDGQPIEWEQAKGFSKYLISTDGQVYSINRDILIPVGYKNGIPTSYNVVTIYNDDGIKKYMLVHRLVYMAHVGAIPKGLQVNHKDENKQNNCIENLELMTNKENCNYGTANKRRSKTLKEFWTEKRKAMAC